MSIRSNLEQLMRSRSFSFRSLRRVCLVPVLALVLASCADDKPLNTFEPRGPKAQDVYDLMNPIWYVMLVVFILVVGGGIAIAFMNRVDGDTLDPNDLPEQVHGNTKLEILWTIAPAVLLAGISVFVVDDIWNLEEKNDPEPCAVGETSANCDGLDVMVIGQQWWWEYRYDVDGDGFFVDGNGDGVVDDRDRDLPLEFVLDPDDVATATELVIPAGEQVDLLLTSRDVIHSFWIPRLNGKRDTVPGRWHTWSLNADSPGKYTGWCTEFCGLSHARMRMSTIALEKDEFEAWLANQASAAEVPSDPEAMAGRELFAANCMSCHVIRDDGADGIIDYPDDFAANVPLASHAAPDLTHFASRTTFAGGIYATYLGPGTDPNDDAFPAENYLDISELAQNPTAADDYRWNSAELKRWVSNAPSRKDMHSEVDPESGLGRGMLPFPQLTDEQLDQIVAYLATLD